jgi:hypothetical protein
VTLLGVALEALGPGPGVAGDLLGLAASLAEDIVRFAAGPAQGLVGFAAGIGDRLIRRLLRQRQHPGGRVHVVPGRRGHAHHGGLGMALRLGIIGSGAIGSGSFSGEFSADAADFPPRKHSASFARSSSFSWSAGQARPRPRRGRRRPLPRRIRAGAWWY